MNSAIRACARRLGFLMGYNNSRLLKAAMTQLKPHVHILKTMTSFNKNNKTKISSV